MKYDIYLCHFFIVLQDGGWLLIPSYMCPENLEIAKGYKLMIINVCNHNVIYNQYGSTLKRLPFQWTAYRTVS